MTLRFLTLSAALAALSLSGCRPEEVDPVVPELGFVSINATEVESSTTPLTVTLSSVSYTHLTLPTILLV